MISAVILTHNDAHQIAKTLSSLQWCDELIVVDDQSKDDTIVIAQKHKAKVYPRKLANDFAAQRNYGLAKAKGEWVLFVDSDEIVSVLLAEEIKQRTQEPGDCVGFFLKRQDFLFDRALKYGETATVRLLRLARKDAGQWRRRVHEVWDIPSVVGELSEPIHHYPHPSVAQFLEEIDRYSTINAQVLHEQKVRAGTVSIVLYPLAKFIINYIVRFGFLDGTAGAVVAFMMSFHSFLTRAKLYVLAHGKIN